MSQTFGLAELECSNTTILDGLLDGFVLFQFGFGSDSFEGVLGLFFFGARYELSSTVTIVTHVLLELSPELKERVERDLVGYHGVNWAKSYIDRKKCK